MLINVVGSLGGAATLGANPDILVFHQWISLTCWMDGYERVDLVLLTRLEWSGNAIMARLHVNE